MIHPDVVEAYQAVVLAERGLEAAMRDVDKARDLLARARANFRAVEAQHEKPQGKLVP